MTGYMSSCPDCGKRLYASKQAAKRIVRVVDRGLRPYRCPSGLGWHCGHLPARVVAGRVTRREVYQ